MATNKTALTPKNIHPWLASLGFLFPTTQGELARFERLYADMVIPEAELLDPDVILGLKARKPQADKGKVASFSSYDNLKMAARNGKGILPQHILDKMKKNHKKPGHGNDPAEEKPTD
jgi:hypothetical protein